MNAQRLISADSHINEPSDLWQTRLDGKFRDRAPYITRNEKGTGFLFVVPGVLVTQIAGGFAAGKSGHELKEHMSKGYEAARPGGWDPAERIKDQEIDGVQAEVIYTTLGARLFGLQDAEFQCACFRAFNGWLAEFCAYDPRRLAGIGLIPLDDIGEAIKELEYCAKSGLRGVAIWAATPEDRPFGSKIYEPFWQAAAEAGLPALAPFGHGCNLLRQAAHDPNARTRRVRQRDVRGAALALRAGLRRGNGTSPEAEFHFSGKRRRLVTPFPIPARPRLRKILGDDERTIASSAQRVSAAPALCDIPG